VHQAWYLHRRRGRILVGRITKLKWIRRLVHFLTTKALFNPPPPRMVRFMQEEAGFQQRGCFL
jgi:hypothetical protein